MDRMQYNWGYNDGLNGKAPYYNGTHAYREGYQAGLIALQIEMQESQSYARDYEAEQEREENYRKEQERERQLQLEDDRRRRECFKRIRS